MTKEVKGPYKTSDHDDSTERCNIIGPDGVTAYMIPDGVARQIVIRMNAAYLAGHLAATTTLRAHVKVLREAAGPVATIDPMDGSDRCCYCGEEMEMAPIRHAAHCPILALRNALAATQETTT